MLFIPPTPPYPKIFSEKDGDLKIQVEKLWREVNALKEMQALQTGEIPSHLKRDRKRNCDLSAIQTI